MKRLLFVFIEVLVIGHMVFCEKHENDLVLLKQWTDQEFYDESGDPATMGFNELNNLIKVDPEKTTLRIYNSDFEKVDLVNSLFILRGGSVTWSGFGGLFFFKRGAIYVISVNNFPQIQKIVVGDSYVSHGLFGKLLLIELEKGSLIGYLLPSDSQKTVLKMDNETVRAYIMKNESKLKGLSLDSEGVPLVQGIPWSRSGFRKYWGIDIGYFDAVDKDLNTCYSREIRDKSGKIIESFALNPGLMNILTLDFEGNVYSMRGYRTYYIGRDWGFSNIRNGKLNDNDVRVRLHPGTNELILGQVDKGTAVKVLEATPTKQAIGNMNAPWYKVKLPSGVVGWVYGYFVDIQK